MSSAAENEPMPCRDNPDDDQIHVFPYVHDDLRAREAKGARDYGGPLVTRDGRVNLWDAYQEALDLAVYLRKEILERSQDGTTKAARAKLEAEIENLKGRLWLQASELETAQGTIERNAAAIKRVIAERDLAESTLEKMKAILNG